MNLRADIAHDAQGTDFSNERLLADFEKWNEASEGAAKLALAGGGQHKEHKGRK